MRITLELTLSLALLAVALTPALYAGEASPFSNQLPTFELQDPAEQLHTQTICDNGAVIIATAPTLKHGDQQKSWQKTLRDRCSDWGKKGPALILLEDMTQSWFKGNVRKRMKAKYKSGQQPILLIDEQATFRKALEAQKNSLKNKTVVLIYDADGKLVHWEQETVKKADLEKIVKLVKAMSR